MVTFITLMEFHGIGTIGKPLQQETGAVFSRPTET